MRCLQVTDYENSLIDQLKSDDASCQLEAIRNIKNAVIGIKSKKSAFIAKGLIPRLLELMVRSNAGIEFAVEGAAILGSFARGTQNDLRVMLDTQAIPILCRGICQDYKPLAVSCLRSLRAYFVTGEVPPDIIYEGPSIVNNLVQFLSQSPTEAECAGNILFRCCKTTEHQTMLSEAGIIPALAPWLKFEKPAVILPILCCFSSLVLDNEVLATRVSETCLEQAKVKDLLINLLSRDKADEIQLAAAKCLANFYRAGSLHVTDEVIHSKVLSTFVRMCAKNKPNSIRVPASQALAFLIEEDSDLQQLASISNHLIQNIASFLNTEEDLDEMTDQGLKEGAFKVFAALAANDEKIRKRVVDATDKLNPALNSALQSECNVLQTAALQCLLSLSRSVQQLRSTFKDQSIWQRILDILQTSHCEDLLSTASSVLCNLLLDFSPCKDLMLDKGVLDILAALTKRPEAPLRLNGAWGLMNLSYDADENVKARIIKEVTLRHLIHLLEDPDIHVTVKVLGLLRNILSGKEGVDEAIEDGCPQVIAAVRMVVRNDGIANDIKDQALCVLCNVVNSKTGKDHIMNDEELLRKLICCLSNDNQRIKLASVSCILNLSCNSEEGALERQTKLRDLGAQKQLQALLTTPNINLFDKVKVALQQFS
ncbi:armadillo repeat-containing protein 8-like [Rhopilema esculentum]|uniref:armadillo repeat-containing protein 8-like n=1 Tax=Rhopilema esculentum TaxID=499914 RepID=UPI0031E17585